ncbi:SDR family NAD(P)-dependent oxidoreductase [Mesorhizobium sp. M1E.F.Ca.ET.045.02.1.1]|nr:SDR family NAD(P)-dependent oxidoreductase [Mesorhizobium sp. M1E.F.Ca.ET.045.02.1.1]
MARHDGTIAVVTGAGHGIGRSIASQLVAEGAAVAVLEIDESKGSETVSQIVGAGGRAVFVKADITNADQVESAFAAAEDALGPVSLLVNNAAFTAAGDLKGMSLHSWHREIDINLHGTYHCICAVLPRMRSRRGGAIVNIASVNGMRYFGNPSYSAAKAGIINLTMSVASEFGRDGIRCNAVSPGCAHRQHHLDHSPAKGPGRLRETWPLVSAWPCRRADGHRQGCFLLRVQ